MSKRKTPNPAARKRRLANAKPALPRLVLEAYETYQKLRDAVTVNPDDVAQAFGEELRAQREHAGETQERMARRSGMDRTYLSRLERGLSDPCLSYILRIAQFLNIEPGTLVRDVARRVRKEGRQ